MKTPLPALRERPGRKSFFWALQLGGWGLFGAGMFVAGVSQWPVLYTAVVKSSLTFFGCAMSLVLRLLYRALNRLGVPLLPASAVAIPFSFGAAGIWMAAHNLVVGAYGAWQRGTPELALRGFPDFVNTIYYFFVLMAWSVLYYGVQAYLELQGERERLLRAESLAHQARLRALRLQLNPHFLFNTLNAISTLVAELRTAEANRMLSRLSEFLRSTLERTETEEITLSEEIDFARRYLEIEQIRFGDRLRVDISVEPEAERALVPPLILQPLVENAVRHAILPRESGGAISIVAARDDGWLTLGVNDDGRGSGETAEKGRGVGLSNTRQRLAELYGPRAELSLSKSDRGGLAVSIRMPFRAAPAGA
ncbi:MAG: sensor histidine kinase [Thermoanaerobaculia bacterium]